MWWQDSSGIVRDDNLVYTTEEAYQEATAILGYPCPCGQCSGDGGAAKSREIDELARDLMGLNAGDGSDGMKCQGSRPHRERCGV